MALACCQEEIYKLMETDIYPRFLKSPEHAALVKPLENGGSYSKGYVVCGCGKVRYSGVWVWHKECGADTSLCYMCIARQLCYLTRGELVVDVVGHLLRTLSSLRE